MGTLKPGPCSVMSWAEHRTWKRCLREQHILKRFWFLDIIPEELRQPCGVPQASLMCVIISIICMYKTCAYSRSIFADAILPSMKWRQLIIYPLWRVLLSLITCCSQSTEWNWAAHALGLVLPACPLSPCRR